MQCRQTMRHLLLFQQSLAQIEASENVLAVPGANAAMAVTAMNGGAPANVAAADGDAPANIGRGDAAAAPVATPAAVAVSGTFANNVNNLRSVRGVGRNHSSVNGTGMSNMSFDNIMTMIVMQQQIDREDRRADTEVRREELKAAALRDEMRRDELQAELRAQSERQNSFMQMIALAMVGGNKKRKRCGDDDKNNDDENGI